MRRTITAIIFLLSIGTAQSQSNITVQYFGLTIHPFGDYTAEIQPYKLDPNANFVANFGGYLSYEKYVWFNIASIRAKQGVFSDCSGGFMGVSHIGINLRLIGNNKHRLSFGIGPTLLYRNSWNRFEIYQNKGFWREHEFHDHSIQWKIIPWGCDFEYNYVINKENEFSFGFVPGFPNAFTFSIGLKHWFNKDKLEERIMFLGKKTTFLNALKH